MVTQSEALQQATKIIEELKGELDRISEAGLQFASVAAIDGKFAALVSGGGYVYALNNGAKPGETVLIHPMTHQIIQTIKAPKLGDISVVSSVKDDLVEVNIRSEGKVVNPGGFKDLKRGDRVLMDPSSSVIIHVIERVKLGKPVTVKPVHWHDVGGHHEAKQLLREAIEMPYKYPKIFKHYNKKLPKGVLLHGEPGCGKTLLGRAVASAIGADGAFLSIKGPEILNEYVGVSERAVRTIFKQANDHFLATNKPAVIFVDEAEAILAVRGGRHSYMEKTIVPAFLTEMDGLEESSAMVILSTNRPELLDPAIIREGRIDHKCYIGRPTKDEAIVIFGIHMNGTPVKGDRDRLIEFATSQLYAPEHGKVPYSGALIEGCVSKAVTAAIRRDITSGRCSGVTEADFEWATKQVINQEALQ